MRLTALVALLVVAASAQEKSDKFAILVSGMDDAAPVADALMKTMKATKPFEPVGPKDDSKVIVSIHCMGRKPTEPFVCMYVSHFNGPSFKTFMGGGLFFAKTAADVADNFFISISQDILERFDDTSTENLREGLEACLLMTETKCSVPDPLQKEFNAKQLTLGQYLMKKHH
jgi:hypothetical protein